VCLTYLPNPENKPCIDHVNTIKTDNRLENLNWVTHKENMQAAVKNGLHKSNINGKRLQKKKVLHIESGIVYESILDASKKLNIPYCKIRDSFKNKHKNRYGLLRIE
jgi:hypothetical protein